MFKGRSRPRVLVVVASAVFALAVSAVPASAETAVPDVVGPLPVTSQSYPFGAADHQLIAEDL